MIKTGDKNFWIAQSIGWGLFGLSNFIIQMTAGFDLPILLANALLPIVSGITVTSAYRYILKSRKNQVESIGSLIAWIILSTLLLTAAFMLLINSLQWLFMGRGLHLVELMGNSAIFLIVLLCWNMIYFCVKYFNRWSQAEVEKWKLLAEMKEAQLGALKSQVNPHFVFNTLNNIRALIREDSERARDMLLNFSDLFRYSLQKTEQNTVSLADELIIVRQYLELVSIQYEDKLQYQIEVAPELEEQEIPPMMLQLLVENAIKHGISQYKDGGTVKIKVWKAPTFLHLQVQNTGSLSKSSTLGQKLGVGLENIRQRLALLYNGEAQLDMKEANQEVIASMQIPLS